jgi:hypothetical protein
MKKNIMVLSFLSAILMVLATLSSVIGTHVMHETSDQSQPTSPLFAYRTQQSLNTAYVDRIHTNYVGKDSSFAWFVSKKTTLDVTFERTARLVENNPELLSQLLQKIHSNVQIRQFLQDYDVDETEISAQISLLKNNPAAIEEKLEAVKDYFPKGEGLLPLGMNTSNPFAIIILLICLLPIFMIIGLIAVGFTILIFRCMNIDQIMEDIIEAFIQGLTQPEY